ncbi:Dabb family protein [Salegentibacter sp. JZCK2]|uniref:Dabb family protein n=1 Tax=Salegentibacter tibetensis TaxID=2873600 RepID=UPI001CCA73B5|nr:Dabb family protein [Salegentibacter tibetensis]MBZ9730071.1 Dabb family protein [Salegentibacter tibetensis]
MIKFLKISLVYFVILFSQSSLAQQDQSEFDNNFTHVVYFWLNNPENEQDRLDFQTSLKKFRDHSEYAKTKFIGTPANTPRDVVDNSYTYSLILTFPSKEIQDKYQNEPAHLSFIEEASHLWKKVQVYDSVGLE